MALVPRKAYRVSVTGDNGARRLSAILITQSFDEALTAAQEFISNNANYDTIAEITYLDEAYVLT